MLREARPHAKSDQSSAVSIDGHSHQPIAGLKLCGARPGKPGTYTRQRLRIPGVERVGETTWRHGRHRGRQELPEAVKGRLPWGGAGHCARASVAVLEQEVMLYWCVLLVPVTAFGVGDRVLKMTSFLRVRNQRPGSTAAALG